MNTDTVFDRFTYAPSSIQQVQQEVWELEDWLDIHPFPKFKHPIKFAIDNEPN